MNILFINSISSKKYGGGEKWMIKAAKGLNDAGHTVYLASKNASHIINAAEKEGIKTKIISIHSDFDPVKTALIAHFLIKNKIDVLVCNLNKDVRVAGLAARIVGHPLVIARHGVKLIGPSWKHKLTITRLSDGIITNTNTIKNEYLQYNWFKNDFIKVIYNGIGDRSNIKPYDFSAEHRNKKVVFAAGRLTTQKGFEYLIDTAYILKKKRQDLVFVVAGKGKLENKLKAKVKSLGLSDMFHFIGFVNNTESYIKGADLFVLSSLFEGMPNVVMESMALGKPVVATDVNGVRELMQNGLSDMIVPSQDPLAMAQKIDDVIDNTELLKEYGIKGLQQVRENFTLEQMTNNLATFFEDKLNEKRQRKIFKKNQKKNKTILDKIFGQSPPPAITEN